MVKELTNTQNLSLYERLGGEPGVKKIVNDVLDKNLSNPLIGHHFRHVDMNKLKQLVFEFFSMGTGGPHTYTGRDMRTAHTGLNISENDFTEANNDTLLALEENGVGQAEIDEVIAILNSLKGEVVRL
ncbi:group 1 truncated hemoglobin [Pontibacter saemangeumensis]|uniref:Group 1 truncated hemoglobin n=1 Tax=Pontibacter saemangeumensis TaxID=1084525 RepID=A0ABP8LLI5_9BACT